MLEICVGNDGVPVAGLMLWGTHYLQPVVPPNFLGGIGPDVDHAHLVIPAEPVVVHDPYLQTHTADVQPGHVKLERLVVDRDERVLLHLCLPLVHSFVLVNHVNFDVRICTERKNSHIKSFTP